MKINEIYLIYSIILSQFNQRQEFTPATALNSLTDNPKLTCNIIIIIFHYFIKLQFYSWYSAKRKIDGND